MSFREKLILTIVLVLFAIAHVGGVVMMGRAQRHRSRLRSRWFTWVIDCEPLS